MIFISRTETTPPQPSVCHYFSDHILSFSSPLMEMEEEITSQPWEVQSLLEHALRMSSSAEDVYDDYRGYLPRTFRRWLEREQETASIVGRYFKLSEAADEVMDLLESLTIFAYQIFRSRNAGDKLAALASFAKYFHAHQALEVGAVLIALQSAWKYFFTDQTSDLEVQALEEFSFQSIREFLEQYNVIKHSKLFEKLYKFMMYALSLSMFDKIGLDLDFLKYDKLAQAAIKKEYHLGPDLIYTFLDTILFMCERGQQCVKTGSLQPLFHSELKYQQWFDSAEKLNRQAHFLSNPSVHGIDRFAYLAELKDVIEKGRSMKRIVTRKEDKLMIGKVLASLELTHDLELTKRAAQQDRIAPFCVLIYGGSSIGKSTLTNLIYQHYGKVRGLQTSSEFKYTRNPTEEYWSNFNSTQWCVQMDDIAFMSPKLGTMDPSLAEMLCVANNVPFVPAQAELQDKGRTPVRAELVIGTTNTEDLNLHAYFSCPLAVQRRFPYVLDVKPKREYVAPDKPGMLCSALIPPLQAGHYPDYWTINVKKVVPSGDQRKHQMGVLVDEGTFQSMQHFIIWFTQKILEHHVIQDQISVCNDTVKDAEICVECRLPKGWCSCIFYGPHLEVQSAEVFIVETGTEIVEWEPLITDNIPAYIEFAQPEEESVVERTDFEKYVDTYDFVTWFVFAYYMFWYKLTIRYEWLSLLFEWWYGSYWFIRWASKSRYKMRILRVVAGYAGKRTYESMKQTKTMIKVGAAVVSLLALYKSSQLFREYFFSFGVQSSEVDTVVDPSLDRSVKQTLPSGKVLTPCGGIVESSEATVPSVVDMVKTATNTIHVKKFEHQDLGVTVKGKGEVYKCPFMDKYPYTSTDISSASKCLKGNFELLRSKVENATYHFATNDGYKVRMTTALNVCGSIYLVNAHGIPANGPFNLDIIATKVDCGLSPTMKQVKVVPSMVMRFPSKDIAFIHLKCRPPGKNLADYFVPESLTGNLVGTYVGREIDGRTHYEQVFNLKRSQESFLSHGQRIMRDFWRGKVNTATQVGDCGMALLADTGAGPVILGIHTLGRAGDVAAMLVESEIMQEAIDHFEPNWFEPGELPLNAESTDIEMGELSPQSIVRSIGTGVADVVGTIKCFRQESRSKVQRTFIADKMEELGYSTTKVAPVMGKEPWKHALTDLSDPVLQIDPDILENVSQSFINDIKDTPPEGVQVYSIQTAVNGIAGVRYCDTINRKSSAGYPYFKSKKFFNVALEGEPGEDLIYPCQEIVDDVHKIIDTYQNRQRWNPIFQGHQKDEPIEEVKAKVGKVRIFTASPYAWTIVVRMYLLSVIVYIQNNRFLFETGPGTICQSLEWEKIREYLVAFGEGRIVAGDYAKFDKRMPSIVIWYAFMLLADICRRAGYSVEQMYVVYGIAYDTSFPCMNLRGDIIKLFGGNPSGHPLTVIINGIANSLYMRYCYFVLHPLRTCVSFKRDVHLMTYGDDNIMGVSEQCDWFNHTAIAAVLANINITYTMADKESQSVPFINIGSANFLKRTWIWDPELPAYVARLDHSSIDKMVLVHVEKANVSPEMHSVDVIETAIREYFWYGREVFEEKKRMFRQVVIDCGLEMCIKESTFPCWDELRKDFFLRAPFVRLERPNCNPFIEELDC